MAEDYPMVDRDGRLWIANTEGEAGELLAHGYRHATEEELTAKPPRGTTAKAAKEKATTSE